MQTILLNIVQWTSLTTASQVNVKQLYAFGLTGGDQVQFTCGEMAAVATVNQVTYGLPKGQSKIEIISYTLKN